MTRLACALLRPRALVYLLGAGSASMLLAAAVFEHVFGLAPCILCLWQRWPHWLVVALAVLVFAYRRVLAAGEFHRYALGLMAVALAGGAGVAFWHVGVEAGLLPGPAACAGAAIGGDASEALDKLLETPPVRCDEVAWSFLGISMAGWNGLASTAMAGLAFAALFGYHCPGPDERDGAGR